MSGHYHTESELPAPETPSGQQDITIGTITATSRIVTTADSFITVDADSPEHNSTLQDSSTLDSGSEYNPPLQNPAVPGTAQASSHITTTEAQAPLGDLAVAERHQSSIGSVSAPDQESLSQDHHNNRGLEGAFSFLNCSHFSPHNNITLS